MYRYEDITTVHIEPTQLCNAACPQCDRNQNGGWDNPYLTGADLTLADYHKIFPTSFIKQLKTIYMCGNLGDPCVSKDSLEAFRYFRGINPRVWLSMNTNGGARDEEYWAELAKVFGRMGAVIFSIDGLEDTNHLYRQKVNWNSVMRNAKAFINAGGRARWDFIVFKHNEHQVEEAQQLSNDLGFETFQFKKTGRFFSTASHTGKESHQAVNKKGELTQKLEKPKDKYVNNALHKEQELVTKHGSMDNYYKQVKIDCKVKKEKSIFITAEGMLMPCCWVGGQMYKWYLPPKHSDIWPFIYKQDLDVKNNSLKEVMNGPFLKAIENSWKDESRPKVCANKCGIEFDQFTEQYSK